MKLVYLHGAHGSETCFNYLRSKLDYDNVVLPYLSSERFEDNLKTLLEKCLNLNDQVFFIGHSLGGIYAYHLAQLLMDKVVGAVTIAAPYGGTFLCDLLGVFFPHYPLWKDVSTRSPVIRSLRKMSAPTNWHQIVCQTKRTGYLMENNDGLLTVSSQMALSGVNYIPVESTHYEVLMNDDVVSIIRKVIGPNK